MRGFRADIVLANLALLISGGATMCYCSILDQCWEVEQQSSMPQVQVASCAGHDELVF